MRHLPEKDWAERTEPNLQIWDQSGLEPVACQFNPAGQHKPHREYLDWLNGYRRRLYGGNEMELPDNYHDLMNPDSGLPRDYRLRYPPQIHQKPSPLLIEKDIQVAPIARAVAEVTGTRQLPTYRVLMSGEAEENPNYRRAVAAVDTDLQKEEDGRYFFHPLLGSIVLQDQYIAESDRASVVHTLAMALGEAATGNVIDIKLAENLSDSRHQHGYAWMAYDNEYGQLLQAGQKMRIAALARRQFGITATGKLAEQPVLEPYRLAEGYYPETGAAVALDLLDAAALKQGDVGVYDLVWDFAKRGRPAAVRHELARLVGDVTDDALTLNQLEALVPDRQGLNVEAVELVEEALGLPKEERPSLALRKI